MTKPNYVWPFPPFRAVWWVGGEGGLWAVSRVKGLACARTLPSGGGLVGCVESRGLGACVQLAFRGLSCRGASVALCLWFRFWEWSVIAICGCFCGPGGVIGGSCGGCGFFLAWGGLFRALCVCVCVGL